MAPLAAPSTTLTKTVPSHPTQTPYQLDPDQTLKASRALLQHIQAETKRLQASASKKNLLAADDSDEEGDDDDSNADGAKPVWLTLTTKQHIVDSNRLKPTKISVPHSLNTSDDVRICLITTDPQRAIKNVVADPAFPAELKAKITRIIGLTKLKARYKTFESRRALLSEHDVFLADERIVNRLPAVLGKVFYRATLKRPIPIVVAGKDKKEKSDGESNAKARPKTKGDGAASPSSPAALAKEIEKALGAVPVSLRPGTMVAARVGLASFTPQQLVENISCVATSLIEKQVTKGWRNVRGIHIKGPTSLAVPIWLADDLWTDREDVEADAPAVAAVENGDAAEDAPKRKRNPASTTGPQAGVRKRTKTSEDAPEARQRKRLADQRAKVFAADV